MTKGSFIGGLGLGMATGALVASKMQKESKMVKKSVNKVKRKAEDIVDSFT